MPRGGHDDFIKALNTIGRRTGLGDSVGGGFLAWPGKMESAKTVRMSVAKQSEYWNRRQVVFMSGQFSWLLRVESFSTFAFTASSILMMGDQGALETFAGESLRRVNAEFAADGHFGGGVVEHVGRGHLAACGSNAGLTSRANLRAEWSAGSSFNKNGMPAACSFFKFSAMLRR